MANHEAVIKDLPQVISIIAFTCFALLNDAEKNQERFATNRNVQRKGMLRVVSRNVLLISLYQF